MTCAYCKNITVCAICGKGVTASAFQPVAQERAGFEVWATDQGFPLSRTDTFDGASYRDLRTQGAWDAWQARAAYGVEIPDRSET